MVSRNGARSVELKIAYIGGGSRGWARKLMVDLALCPDLGGHVALYDIDREAAELNQRLGNWLHTAGQPQVVSSWHYTAVSRLEDALRGADFVVLSIQPGSLEIMAREIAIAEEYGMYFPVGDTTGAPGLVRGLRAATTYEGFARAIAACCPAAWVINYTNPMSICTRTLTRVEPALKVFGCCHEVFNVQRMLASLVSQRLDVWPAPPRQAIQVNVTGINHFTWIDRAAYRDVDLLALLREHIALPGVLRPYTQAEVEGWGDWFRSADQVKFELFRRYGMLAAAGDRHLVEFLPGFTRSPEELFRWGVIRTPVTWRIERQERAAREMLDVLAGQTPLQLQSSGEEGVGMIRALAGLDELVTNVNLPNQGQVANLPADVVVETNARLTRNEVRPLAAGALPPALHSMIAGHVNNQQLIVEAALGRDKDLAFQAVFADPTNRLPLDTAWEMFNRMLEASQPCLPDWPHAGQQRSPIRAGDASSSPAAARPPWSRRMADSALARYNLANPRWHYKDGLLFKAIDQVWRKTGEPVYWQRVLDYVNYFVDDHGDIRTYAIEEYNLDQVNPGKLLFPLYAATGDERYRQAIRLLVRQLQRHPRTREGGFWHKQIYPFQMWLDGIYMAGPFYAEYAQTFDEPAIFDDVAFQITAIAGHTRDARTGLLYHAWDESRDQRWADPASGCSPHFWSRAIGWYVMAIVDILDLLPPDHACRPEISAILQRAIAAVARVQDPESGLWRQVLDQGDRAGNYLEASGSCMFIYAIGKGVRQGYLEPAWLDVAVRGFQGVVGRLITGDEQGQVHLHGICATAGLGGNPYRDGSYSYYVGEPIQTNDLHGVGPFILAALEMEQAQSASIPPT